MVWADVSPFFTQHHSDVADVPQTQAFAKNPEGFTAWGSREPGHSGPLIILTRHMRDQVFERLALARFPRPGDRKHKAPAPGRVIRIALEDHFHILLGAIGRVTLHNDALGPCGWDKMAHHLTEQRIFRPVRRMGFGPNQAKGHGEAIDVPRGDQQGKAHPPKPRLMLAFTPLLGHGVLRPPLRFHTPIPSKIQCAVLGRWQGLEGFLDPPHYQQMDIPIGRLAHAAQAPDRDRARCPAGEFF